MKENYYQRVYARRLEAVESAKEYDDCEELVINRQLLADEWYAKHGKRIIAIGNKNGITESLEGHGLAMAMYDDYIQSLPVESGW